MPVEHAVLSLPGQFGDTGNWPKEPSEPTKLDD
jgi:hypothetical protein